MKKSPAKRIRNDRETKLARELEAYASAAEITDREHKDVQRVVDLLMRKSKELRVRA